MKIIWDWSLESEANRLLQASGSIASGFFHLQHFLPLPWTPVVKYYPAGVYLPNLPYSSLPHFWTQVAQLDPKILPLKAPAKLVAQTQSLLATLPLTPPDTQTLQNQVQQVLPKVVSWLQDFTHELFLPSSLTLYPTYFGTGGSFSRLEKSGGDMAIYLRVDQGIATIAECFLTGCLREMAMKNLKADWGQTEFLVDWLIHSSSLSSILPADPTWSGTLSATHRPVSSSLQAQSTRFLSLIGAPTPSTHHFTLQDTVIRFGDTPLSTMSAREHTILTKLVEKSPAPVTTDELADLLFPSIDKFSLAALTKCVERLRDKLERMGISRHYIATTSGVGYYLKN